VINDAIIVKCSGLVGSSLGNEILWCSGSSSNSFTQLRTIGHVASGVLDIVGAAHGPSWK
jgi:hypothetical protein